MLHDTVPANWQPGDRIAILVHGLTGSHPSAKVRRLARLFLAERLRVVRLDLRGAGKGLPLARLPNHAGRSDDVRASRAEVHRWSPASPLLLIGLSLGGNFALKLAGEATEYPVPGLDRVASLGPPIDLERCATRMEQRHNRPYGSYFVRALIAETRQRQRFFPDLPRKGLALRSSCKGASVTRIASSDPESGRLTCMNEPAPPGDGAQ